MLCVLGLVWRLAISALTPLPSEDGVNYLWMAERLAHLDARAALSEVFPPLLPLLTALPIALGVEPFRAAQLVLCLCGAAALPFLVRAGERVAPVHGRAAGWFAVLAPLPVRFGAEAYTEPLFVLLTAIAVWLGLRGRLAAMSWAAGLAFWTRPEAAVLVLGFALARPRAAWRALWPFAVCVAALVVWQSSVRGEVVVVPMHGLIAERSVLAGGIAQLADNLVHLPWLWVEAFGVVGVLAAYGMVRARRRVPPALAWTLVLALLVICAFLARRRFLVDWWAVMSPLAVLGLAAVPRGLQRAMLAVVVLSSAVLSLRTTEPDRAAERAVGEHLRAQLAPGEAVAGDMTRVLYYAGQRPLPPRPFTAQELIARGCAPEVRFFVLRVRREDAGEVQRGLADVFAECALPDELRAGAEERGIAVLERR
jgi:hypothetical protein